MKTIKGGLGTPTVQFFDASSTAYDASLEKAYPYDVAKAKQLIAQAGYPNGFSMTLPDFSPVFPDQQAAMTEALKAIGISITYQPITGDQVVGSVIGGKWPINYFTLTSTDAWGMARRLAADAPFNPFHTDDPKVSRAARHDQRSSGDAQTTAFHALDRYLVDQAWFAPWDYVKGSYITGKGVKATAVPGPPSLRWSTRTCQLIAARARGGPPRARAVIPPTLRESFVLSFLLRRLAAGVLLVFVVATLTFFLTNATGSDPARRIAGTQAGAAQVAAETRRRSG